MIGKTLASGRVFRFLRSLGRIPRASISNIVSTIDLAELKGEQAEESPKKHSIFSVNLSKLQPEFQSPDNLVDKLQTIFMLQQVQNSQFINRCQKQLTTLMNALASTTLTFQHLRRVVYAAKKFLVEKQVEVGAEWLVRELQQLMKSQNSLKIVAQVQRNVGQGKLSTIELINTLPLVSHLEPQATRKILHSLSAWIAHIHPQTIAILIAQLLKCDINTDDVPIEELMSSITHPYIYNNIKIIYKLVLLVQKHGRSNSIYNIYLFNRLQLEPNRTETYSGQDIEIICQINRIMNELQLNKRRISQHSDNRNRIFNINNQLNKNVQSLKVALKIQKQLLSIAHLSDFITRKINDLMSKTQVEAGTQEAQLLVDVTKQIINDLNTPCLAFLLEKDLAPQLLEYPNPFLLNTHAFVSNIVKNFFSSLCPLLLFKINNKRIEQEDYKGIDARMSILSLLQRPGNVIEVTKKCFEKLSWKDMTLADLTDVMKYLANNWHILNESFDLKSGEIWQTFGRLIKSQPEDEKIMEFLYFSTFIYDKIHYAERKLPLSYFKKHVQAMLNQMDTSFTSPVSSILRKNYNFDYFVPLMSRLDLPAQEVSNIMQKFDFQIARSVGSWFPQILDINLKAFVKLNYTPSDILMSRLIEFMTSLTVYLESKKSYMPNPAYINQQLLPVLRWIIAHPFKVKPHSWKTGGLQVAIDSLYEHFTIEDLLRVFSLLGSDRRNYLHQFMKNIKKTNYNNSKYKQFSNFLKFFDDEWTDDVHKSEPPANTASAQQYEYYLLRCLHHRDSKYVLRKQPLSREEMMLNICLELSTEFMKEMVKIDYESTKLFEHEFCFKQFEHQFEQIFNIKIANLNPERAIKMEIPEQNYSLTKVAYLVSSSLGKKQDKLPKYSLIQLPIYSAAEETLRSLLFGNPDLFEVGRKMHPSAITSQIVTELINQNIKYMVCGPILKISNSKNKQKKQQQQSEVIIETSPQSYRIRVIWAYILNQQGYRVTFFENSMSSEQIKEKVKKLFD